MKKELYDLLNNAEINLDEYKIEPLSSEEKQEMKSDVLKRLHRMEEKTMKNKKKKEPDGR